MATIRQPVSQPVRVALGVAAWVLIIGTWFALSHSKLLPPFALPENTPDLFAFRADLYLMRGVEVAAYREHMRPRSKCWRTVHLPVDAFRRIVRPFSEFLVPRRETVPAEVQQEGHG